MTVMPEQSSEDDTEMTAFEVEETKTDSNIQNVIFSSQDDVKTAEKSSSVPESSQDFSKKEIKTNNSNTLPKLGIKTNNFSVYGLLISLLGIILMKFSKGKLSKNNTIQLSKNIKKHRLMKDMSQNELALRIGVSHQAQNGRLVKISQIL